MAARSLEVSDDALRLYQPREIDIQIAEAMASGHVFIKDIAEAIGLHSTTVSKILKDPLVFAWCAEQVHRTVRRRIGMVDAAVVREALSGNMRAAEVFYKRHGQIVNRNLNVNVSTDFDPRHLTDEQLAALLEKKTNARPTQAPPPDSTPSVDVEAGGP
jgi:hypothetical protein